MLALLMTPFFSLAALLVETQRYQSTVKALDEALGINTVSILSDYDGYVHDRFGLLTVSQDNDPTSLLRKYYGLMDLTDLRGVALAADELTGAGQFPLSDINVLKRQLLQNNDVQVFLKGGMELLNISDMIDTLEKNMKSAEKWLNRTKDLSSAVGKTVDAYEAVDKASKASKKTTDATGKYHDAFEEWVNAVESLQEHLEEEPPEAEPAPAYRPSAAMTEEERMAAQAEAEERAEQARIRDDWEKEERKLRIEAEYAQQDYEKAITSIYGALDEVTSAVEKAVEKSHKAMGSFIKGGYGAAGSEAEKAGEKVLSAASDGVDAMNSRISDTLSDFIPPEVKDTILALEKEREAVEEYTIGEFISVPEEDQYHYVDVEVFQDSGVLDDLLVDDEAEIVADVGETCLNGLAAMTDKLFSTRLIYDPRLSCVIDSEFYQTRYGGLPSAKGVNTSAAEKAINDLWKMGTALNSFAGALMDENFFRGVIEMLKSLWDFLTVAVTLLVDIITLLGEVLGRLAEFIRTPRTLGQQLIYSGYMAYNLPNRTTYASGTGTTGYSFDDIPAGDAGLIREVPFINLLETSGATGAGGNEPAYAFRGAELEYIMFGEESELDNQVKYFMALYLFRLLLDVPSILSNEEVAGYAAAASVFAPAVYIVYFLLEPMIDNLLLVNEESVPLVKTEPYMTAGNIMDVIDDLVKVKSSPEDDEGKSKEEKKPVFNREMLKDMLSLDYTQHSVLLLMLFGQEDAMLTRLQDLIQMESTSYRFENATASERILGTQKDFNIYNSYTGIRTAAKGSIVQLLPVSAGWAKNSAFQIERSIYRGY